MGKKVQIVLHLFPREIDDVDNLINQLKVCSKYIENLTVDFNITLNLNPEIVNWEKSLLPKQFIIDKFNHIVNKLDWTNENFINIVEDNSVYGFLELRIKLVETFPNYEGYIFLDPDMILDDRIFYYLEQSLNSIQEESFIVSPQMYKFWDSSWNVISYDKSFDSTFDVNTFDPYIVKVLGNEVKLVTNHNVKFAGGWFTYISKPLLEQVPFPKSATGYGSEDTFISMFATSKNFPQYIMEGVVVQENRKYLNNQTYVDYISYNTDKLRELSDRTKVLLSQAIQQL